MTDLAKLGPGLPIHVYPTWGRAHDTDGGQCWCNPRVDREPGCADVVVHNEPPS